MEHVGKKTEAQNWTETNLLKEMRLNFRIKLRISVKIWFSKIMFIVGGKYIFS